MGSRAERIITVRCKCPTCGTEFKKDLKIKNPEIKTVKVKCLKCDHSWTYHGNLKHRIRCPKCGSSRNEANRRIFGKWKPPRKV